MDATQQPLNRAARRAQGRYASAGRGYRRRAALKALSHELRAEIRQH